MKPKKSSRSSLPSKKGVQKKRVADLQVSLETVSDDSFSDQQSTTDQKQPEWSQEVARLQAELSAHRKTMDRLQEELDRFHIAAKCSQEGFWEGRPIAGKPWNVPETPAWYSPQFIALLGFEPDEFPPVLNSWASRIHPEDRERVFQALSDHIEHQIPYEIESRLLTKQGEYRWFQAKGEAIFDDQGTLIRGGGTIRDITDRKMAQEAMRKEHALLQAVVEGTSDIVYVKDPGGKYVLINSAGAQLLGQTIEDMLGKTDQQLVTSNATHLFTDGDDDVLTKKTSCSFEIEVENQDAVSRTFLVTKELVVDSEWGIEGILGIARDITFRKVAELTLQEREKRYRAIMDHAYDLIAEVDESGRFLYASQNFKDVLGFTGPALNRATIFEFVHPQDLERVTVEFGKIFESQNVGRSVYRYRDVHENYRWFESTGRVYQTALGERRGVIVTRDITDRKKLQEALEAVVKSTVSSGNPQFFRNLVQQLAQPLRVPMVFLAERVPGSPSQPRVLAFWNTDHFEPTFEYDSRLGPCGEVLEGETVYVAQGALGLYPHSQTIQSLNVQGYFGLALFDSHGDVVGHLAIMDQNPLTISAQEQSLVRVFAARAGAELERKYAQEALEESQKRYRALYDQTPLMYFTVDANLMVLSVNQFGADLLGYSMQDLVGQSVLKVVYPDDHPHFLKEAEKILQSDDGTFQTEFRKVKNDGQILWVRETVQQRLDPHQGKTLLLSCEDITDRKKAEDALLRSEKQLRHTQKMEAVGTLAGGIAHDFNNILGAILGYAELATTQVGGNAQLGGYLEEVLTAGHRAKELVKQILAFSRRSDQERQAVDLYAIVEEALRLLRATVPKTIAIESENVAGSPVVFADSTQIHQVVMNLCANAEQAMREKGGTLRIALSNLEIEGTEPCEFPEVKPGSYVKLTLEDNGHGIPPNLLERIFEPFFTTKVAGEGTGLGLAVVHGIIIGHGGGISVKSKVGKGTTFSMVLPKLDVELSSHAKAPENWPRGSGRVLFVDDEEMLAKWGEQLLTHLGYSVVSMTNPYEALEVFRDQSDQFDVVVTDQAMPTMDGETLARALLDIRHDIPVILCTGFSHTITADKAKLLGIKEFLMKPVNGAVLAGLLQELLLDSPPSSLPS